MGKHIVGRTGELPPGARKIVEVEGRSIGVFNVHGVYYALRNSCPHQLAPLCRGTVTGTTIPSQPGEYHWAREGEILRCPWHGWEFDITTGQSVFNPHRLRVKTYTVTVEPEQRGQPPEVSTDGAHDVLTSRAEEEDPSVETFPVTVEDGLVVLHV